MALESAVYISDLVRTNPVGNTDPKSQGDNHIRMIKAAIQDTFPNITGPVTLTQDQLNTPSFVAGTRMLFVQTVPPVGWTKDTSHDNKALRIVSGSAGGGGATPFTNAFSATRSVAGTVGDTTLTTVQIPSHAHTFNVNSGTESQTHTHTVTINSTGTTDSEPAHSHTVAASFSNSLFVQAGGSQVNVPVGSNLTTSLAGAHTHTVSASGSGTTSTETFTHVHNVNGTTAASGSGGSHTHTFAGTSMDFGVKYVDAVIGVKN